MIVGRANGEHSVFQPHCVIVKITTATGSHNLNPPLHATFSKLRSFHSSSSQAELAAEDKEKG